MKMGWETPARGIYFLYSFFCHQLPQRSWFLFGESFTYPKDEILLALNGNTDPVVPSAMRVFIGTPEMGWKVAWSDRMVSFYSGWVVVGLVYALVRRCWAGLSWKWALLLLLPLALDGGTHLLSDLGNIREGFRESNVWLAALTNHYFPPEFYAGDQWGSFNSIARLITGALGAAGLMGLVLPFLDRTISREIDDAAKQVRWSAFQSPLPPDHEKTHQKQQSPGGDRHGIDGVLGKGRQIRGLNQGERAQGRRHDEQYAQIVQRRRPP